MGLAGQMQSTVLYERSFELGLTQVLARLGSRPEALGMGCLDGAQYADVDWEHQDRTTDSESWKQGVAVNIVQSK